MSAAAEESVQGKSELSGVGMQLPLQGLEMCYVQRQISSPQENLSRPLSQDEGANTETLQ